jgi:hypothetical protein
MESSSLREMSADESYARQAMEQRESLAVLVTRLCLVTHCLRGSASRARLTQRRTNSRGRASPAVGSQAEPGNQCQPAVRLESLTYSLTLPGYFDADGLLLAPPPLPPTMLSVMAERS